MIKRTERLYGKIELELLERKLPALLKYLTGLKITLPLASKEKDHDI